MQSRDPLLKHNRFDVRDTPITRMVQYILLDGGFGSHPTHRGCYYRDKNTRKLVQSPSLSPRPVD